MNSAFSFAKKDNVLQGVPQDVPQELSDMQKKIFESIKNDPKISRKKIADQLAVSTKTIARNLAQMRNYVQFIGRGYSGHWEIIFMPDGEKLSRHD